jgi:hypothetical protein
MGPRPSEAVVRDRLHIFKYQALGNSYLVLDPRRNCHSVSLDKATKTSWRRPPWPIGSAIHPAELDPTGYCSGL